MRRYLALGDSYTIGEGVDPEDRWPNQLAVLLRAAQIDVADPEIIARTGWTAGELAAAIRETAPPGAFDLVTLLVGVNDQYRGCGAEEYALAFSRILEMSIGLAGNDARRLVVVSVPDWSVTPFASDRDRGAIAREIDAFNAIGRSLAERNGAAWVDVTAESRRAGAAPEMLAPDGLHPSALAYAKWSELVLPFARRALA